MRKNVMKKVSAVILASVMAISMMACGSSDSATTETSEEVTTETSEEATTEEVVEVSAVEQDAVIVMQSGEPTTLDPCFSSSTSEIQIMEHIFSTITTHNENNEIVGCAATEWEVSEDGLTWTFKFREDIYFSDGVQLTANDVKYTFDRTLDPETNARGNYLWVLGGIYLDSVEVIDDFTVEFHTTEPVPVFPVYMADILVLPEHYYSTTDLETTTIAPLGSGAYVLESWDTANNIITLSKNHDSWGELSGEVTGDIETIIWKTSTEDSTRVAEIVTGGADIINSVPADMADQITGSAVYTSTEGSQRQFICLNFYNQTELMETVEFRQAMNYAIDFDTIIDTLRGGVGTRTASFVNAPYLDPDLGAYEYDTEKAIELLESVGIVDSDGNGFREFNGEEISLSLVACGKYSKDVEIMQAVAEYFKQIGLNSEVTTGEWSSFISEMDAKTLDCDMFFIGSGSVFEVQTDLTDFLTGNAGNYGDWSNEEYDSLMAELSNEFDTEARTEIGYEIQAVMKEEAPIIFFTMGDNAYGISEKTDWTPVKSGRIYLMNTTYLGE